MKELRDMPHGTFIFDPGFGLCRLVSKAGGVATIECKRGTDSIERPLFFVAFDLIGSPDWDTYDPSHFEYTVRHPVGVAAEDHLGFEFWNGTSGWCEFTRHYLEASKTLSVLFRRPRSKPIDRSFHLRCNAWPN